MGFRRAGLRLLLICAFMMVSVARADSWTFKKGLHKTTTEFGDIRFVATVDARKNQSYPPMWVDMYDGRTLLARIQGIFVSRIVASENEQIFVVLSDTGLAPLAAIVVARSGQIVKLVGHDSAALRYCSYSATLDRTWFDDADPDAQFDMEGQFLRSMSVRGCDGERVLLYGE